MEDDAVVMIIISDDKDQLTDDNEIKSEPPDHIDYSEDCITENDIDRLLEKAMKFGQHLPLIDLKKEEDSIEIKQEINTSYSDSDVLKYDTETEIDEVEVSNCDPKTKDEYYLVGSGYSSDDEEFFMRPITQLKNRMEHDLLSARRHDNKVKSYVARLRKKDPKYKDESVLIEKITSLMKKVKTPHLENFYVRTADNKFCCAKCDYVGVHISTTKLHYLSKHGPYYLVCFACGLEYRSSPALLKHELRCHSPDKQIILKARAHAILKRGRKRPYMLPKIPKKYVNLRSREKINSKVQLTCRYCNLKFTTADGVLSHERLHRGERPFMCDKCEHAYTSKAALNRHLELHENKRFECDHCGKVFKLKKQVKVHLETHLPQAKYPCLHEGCEKRYAQRSHMMVHYNTVHLKMPLPYDCKLCPKRYGRMSLLKVHLKKKHGFEVYSKFTLYRNMPKGVNLDLKKAIAVQNGDLKTE